MLLVLKASLTYFRQAHGDALLPACGREEKEEPCPECEAAAEWVPPRPALGTGERPSLEAVIGTWLQDVHALADAAEPDQWTSFGLE